MAKRENNKMQKGARQYAQRRARFSAVRLSITLCSTIFITVFVVIPLLADELPAANAISVDIAKVSTQEAFYTIQPVRMESISVQTEAPLPTLTPTPSPTCKVVISQYALLQAGDQFPSVQNLQARLIDLGYLEADEPCSEYNTAIADAVSLFQRAHDCEMNGIADSDLQETLYSDQALSYEAKLGDSGADVRGMQLVLTTLGYYAGKTNGYFGVATEAALQDFQRKNGLPQDNIFDVDDRDVLYSEQARPLIDPTPTPTPVATPRPTRKPTTEPPAKTAEPAPGASPTKTEAPPVPSDSTPSGGGGFHASGDVDGIISVAEAQLGKGYALGDEGPNTFDCSGLVYYCLSQNGVSIGRYSSASYAKVDKWARVDSMNELQRGDLLFFRDDKSDKVSHVGIYIGGGKMIDASSNRGEVVKRSCTTDYWRTNFICARRIWG